MRSSLPGTLIGGNSPVAYSYQPNLLQLDQTVVIIERLPDTVQTTAQSYYQGQVDPGVKPTFSACGRYQTDSAYDNLYVCANGLNTGTYGYNNLQWYGFTYYHKFDELWHIAIEFWHMHENNVPNVNSIVNSSDRTDHAQSLLLPWSMRRPWRSVRAIPTRPAPRASGRPSPT